MKSKSIGLCFIFFSLMILSTLLLSFSSVISHNLGKSLTMSDLTNYYLSHVFSSAPMNALMLVFFSLGIVFLVFGLKHDKRKP